MGDGPLSTDHHRGAADDLLRGRGRPGAAVRGPPDASLVVRHRRHLRAALRRTGVALLRSPERGVARHPEAVDPRAPDDDVDFLRGL